MADEFASFLAGEFGHPHGTFAIFGDVFSTLTGTELSTGGVMGTPLTAGPSNPEQWEIIGFNVQGRIGLLVTGGTGNIYGRMGDIWIGLTADNSLINRGGDPNNSFQALDPAQFPNDLSTFVKLWSGQDDPIRIIDIDAGVPDNNQYQLVLGSIIFPSPILMRPGAQMGMVMVITPSLLNIPGGGIAAFGIGLMKYSLMYTRR